jgi:HPt (histidine-containing phosphotransfer) domain-containing protein
MLIAIHRLKDTKDNTLGFLVAVVPAANLVRSLLPHLAPDMEIHLAINQLAFVNSIDIARHYLQSHFTSELMVNPAKNLSIPITVRVGVDPDILFHKVRARILRVCLIVVLVIITCGIAAFYFARSLLKPIHTLIPVIEAYRQRNYEAALPSFHYQEFENLAVVLSDLSQSVREQEHRLETLVAARTLELQRKSNDMQTLLAHMPLGVLTIDGAGRIQPEYSRAAVELVGEPWSPEASILRGLLQRCGLTQDELAIIKSALEASVGQDPIAFDLNQHLLPRTLHFQDLAGRQKILQVEWSPIVFDHKTQSILVTLNDTTAQRALEAEARKHGLEIAISEEILGQDLAAVERFFQHHRPMIQRLQTPECFPRLELLRRLHTLKGNARTLGFRALAEATHGAEEYIIKEGGTHPPSAFLECWELYARAFEVKYRPILKGSEQRRRDDRRTLRERCRALLASWSLSREPWHEPLMQCIQEPGSDDVDLGSLLSQSIQGQAELCQRSGKLLPQLAIHGDPVLLPLPLQEIFLGIFNHLITNSLVHGLETTTERRKLGKAAQGSIVISAKLGAGFLTLNYTDDGRGLPLERIAAQLGKAVAAVTTQEIEEWIFHDGHSTATNADQFAGRGLGMSAVLADIQRLGGSIHFVCPAQETVNPCLSFALNMRLPWPDAGEGRWEETA